MAIQNILNKFNRKGYAVTKSVSTGHVVVTPPWGAVSVFKSYNAAHNFYFN